MKRIWVDQNFHIKIKKEAADLDISILEYTKMLGVNKTPKKNEKKFIFKI